MDGGEIDEKFVGFDVDLESGIFNMLMKGRDYVESEEVWLELSKNLMVGETTETHKNGYMVGSVRAFKKFNDFGEDINCKEIAKGDFEFEFIDKEDANKSQITFRELETIIKILRLGFKNKKDKIIYSDARKNISRNVEDSHIKKCLYIIWKKNLLEDSTWEAKFNMKTGNVEIVKDAHKEMSISKKISHTKMDFEHIKDLDKREILKMILNWYENTSKIDLDVNEIHHRFHHIKITEIKEYIKEMFKNGFDNLGINCNLIVQPMGRGEKIIIIRAVAKI